MMFGMVSTVSDLAVRASGLDQRKRRRQQLTDKKPKSLQKKSTNGRPKPFRKEPFLRVPRVVMVWLTLFRGQIRFPSQGHQNPKMDFTF